MVCDSEDRSFQFLYSKEGVNQGDPLAMITYGIGVLILIQEFRDTNRCITQPWYADNAEEGGEFGRILTHFWYLQARWPPRGYSPEATKSILVVDQ